MNENIYLRHLGFQCTAYKNFIFKTTPSPHGLISDRNFKTKSGAQKRKKRILAKKGSFRRKKIKIKIKNDNTD